MAVEAYESLAGFSIPQYQLAIVVARNQSLAVRAKGHCRDRCTSGKESAGSLESEESLACKRVPQCHRIAACGNPLVVRTERHAVRAFPRTLKIVEAQEF